MEIIDCSTPRVFSKHDKFYRCFAQNACRANRKIDTTAENMQQNSKPLIRHPFMQFMCRHFACNIYKNTLNKAYLSNKLLKTSSFRSSLVRWTFEIILRLCQQIVLLELQYYNNNRKPCKNSTFKAQHRLKMCDTNLWKSNDSKFSRKTHNTQVFRKKILLLALTSLYFFGARSLGHQLLTPASTDILQLLCFWVYHSLLLLFVHPVESGPVRPPQKAFFLHVLYFWRTFLLGWQVSSECFAQIYAC